LAATHEPGSQLEPMDALFSSDLIFCGALLEIGDAWIQAKRSVRLGLRVPLFGTPLSYSLHIRIKSG
jgi:hypothetical protein